MFDGKTVKGFFYFSLVREENVENEEIPSLKQQDSILIGFFFFSRIMYILNSRFI